MNNRDYIINLRNLINKYNYLYYVLGKPLVTDHLYDQLLLKLKLQEKKYLKIININSPTNQIGYKENNVTNTGSINNMLSLEKSFSKLDIIKFQYRSSNSLGINKVSKVICEPKIDGLAILLIYKNGILENIITRKDGIKIQNLKKII